MSNTISTPKKAGLVLSGGGARAAYQVGVLTALAELVPEGAPNPFQIICGTSAGAFNACAMAARATEFHVGVERLARIWSNFSCDQVYYTDFKKVASHAWHLARTLMGAKNPSDTISLLDNTPLRELLNNALRLHKIQEAIDSGHLHALGISASGYTSGESVTFYQGNANIEPWHRARRIGSPSKIDFDHLLASSAIPLIFPAVKIHREYFGDGAIRQQAPLSPALHLGADKVLVVGVSGNLSERGNTRKESGRSPSFAQIISHVMNSAFLDSFEGDIERLQRVNNTISLIPEKTRDAADFVLRPVELLVISPSQPLDEIAAKHVKSLPRTIRFFLRGTGATDASGASALSYLLFEAPFCRELIALGYHDTIVRKEQVLEFLEH